MARIILEILEPPYEAKCQHCDHQLKKREPRARVAGGMHQAKVSKSYCIPCFIKVLSKAPQEVKEQILASLSMQVPPLKKPETNGNERVNGVVEALD